MENMTKWYFYDPETKQKTKGLTLEEAQMTLLSFRPKELQRTLYSRSDNDQWLPLNQIINSATSPFAGLGILASANEPEQKKTNAYSNSSEETIIVPKKTQKMSLELVIMNSTGQIIRTAAKNPTIEGSFIEMNIPADFYNSLVDIVILNHKVPNQSFSKIKLKAQIINKDSSPYVIFKLNHPEQKSALVESLNICENHSHQKL